MFKISPGSNHILSLKLPARHIEDAISKDRFIDQALKAIGGISRTFSGESNVDVSKDKPKLALEGDRLVSQAKINFRETLKFLFSYPEIILDTESKVAQLIGVVGLKLNENLTSKTRGFWRTWETPFQQIPVDKIKQTFRDEFCSGFMRRFADPLTDPIEFAFWIEKYGNTILHPLSDGCGRLTKALSAWVLGRANLFLPCFNSREEYFEILESSWEKGLELYRKKVI